MERSDAGHCRLKRAGGVGPTLNRRRMMTLSKFRGRHTRILAGLLRVIGSDLREPRSAGRFGFGRSPPPSGNTGRPGSVGATWGKMWREGCVRSARPERGRPTNLFRVSVAHPTKDLGFIPSLAGSVKAIRPQPWMVRIFETEQHIQARRWLSRYLKRSCLD
jgi:hypothetical protein